MFRAASFYLRVLCTFMAMGAKQRQTLAILTDPRHRGRWWDTRHIANLIHPPWATKNQTDSVRQALKRLEEAGHVVGTGFWAEWRSAAHPEASPPPSIRRVVQRIWRGSQGEER